MLRNWIVVCLAAVTTAAGVQNSDKLYQAIRANDLVGLNALLAAGANPNAADARGVAPLMYAAEAGSLAAMKALVDRGADVNAQNEFGSTALMWSVSDPNKVRLLLDNGADVNKKSKTGRTALLIAAFMSPSAEVARMLLAKGADPRVVDTFGFTTLNAATAGNDMATIRMMVEAGVDVNAGERGAVAVVPGITPLINAAANGNIEAVKPLLAKGADVNAVTTRDHLQKVKNGPIAIGGITALMAATAYGPAAMVKLLLDAGADPNVADIRGMTPLMLATATDRHDPEIARLLVAYGARLDAKTKAGETPLDWARKMGFTNIADSLAQPPKTNHHAPIGVAQPELRDAVERSVGLLERSTAEFFVKSGCVSCHAQSAAEFAISAARAKGILADEKLAKERQQQIVALLNPAGPMLLERLDPPGSPDTTTYILEALARANYEPTRLTDALAAHVASQQTAEGSWHLPGMARPPMEDGDFTRTAFAIRALKTYGAPGRETETNERIQRARQWLLNAETVTGEDRAMRLVGLAESGAEASVLRHAGKSILARQRPDGGWGQRDELESDAYATGMTLWALAESGVVDTNASAYRKGVNFLLSTQNADGSWYVASRAPKIQPYFEGGFPYHHDQWISSMATGWATNALALALDNAPEE